MAGRNTKMMLVLAQKNKDFRERFKNSKQLKKMLQLAYHK